MLSRLAQLPTFCTVAGSTPALSILVAPVARVAVCQVILGLVVENPVNRPAVET